MSQPRDVHCRHCGVRLRRVLGRWYHVKHLGPLPCTRPEPEDVAGPSGA